jgi:hypothetical protein
MRIAQLDEGKGVTSSPFFFPSQRIISPPSPTAGTGMAVYNTPMPSVLPAIFINACGSPHLSSWAGSACRCTLDNRWRANLFREKVRKYVKNG